MDYLILSQPDYQRGLNLSAAIWKLSVPSQVQAEEGRVTTHWSQVIEHPISGQVALALPDSDGFIHPNADLRVISPYLTGVLTDDERTSVSDQIRDAKGGRLAFGAILGNAPSLTSKIKTQAQMEADGWFAE